MNRKRSSALIGLAVVATLAAAGCGSDDTKETSTSNAASSISCDGAKDKLSAEGSSAQKNAFDEFSAAYAAACSGKTIAYNPTGSGAGREQFLANNVDFAGSDSALSEEEAARAKERCAGNDAWNLPIVFGPVALAYNVDGVDKLVLNADVTAKIFTGAISTWNDPAIAALNSGVTLPDTKITPVYRSDKSGTSENFGRYLETAAPQSWDKGHDGTWKGGVGEGAEKSAGVAEKVKNIAGSITYVEKGYADDLGLVYAQVDNGAGAVELTADTAAKSVDTAKFKSEGNNLTLDLASIYGTKDAGAYPILLATYEIVCSKGYDAATSIAVKNFLTVAVNEGQSGLAEIGYAPLPDAFKERVTTAINAIA
ncbi:phosphate ABC transporter substrate-binding protein PstS [Antrihabitans sp. YC2-6]|uniref:phosphate ABC transporter substrate-binding protein PstS n=1 Tax=Antrihabitans sp. YC2-6 TaxID=2799498 RepID=UPI0018F3381E|nr:phosphate ABC transporter substrate-binding protein PstS [Antrihabitans sp. YC2-6]MBJ8344528.1 phosphate ABC transporter substrate-binding protein PstS [Antrihabitans sp. YC2-6]